MPAGAEPNFQARVYELVAQIPAGRLISYGDIAALCGSPYAARIVGGLAHHGPIDLPWHRVVNKSGGLASGYYGGKEGHKAALEAEGVVVNNYQAVDFENLRWSPSND